MTYDFSSSDVLTATEVTKMTDRTRIWSASSNRSPLIRLSAALNENIDWDDLERLVDDSDPMVAAVAKTQLNELKKVERIFLYMIDSKEQIVNPKGLMDGYGITVVRHFTKRNVEGLTTAECISEMKAQQKKDKKYS